MTLGIRYHFYSGWPKAQLQFADKPSYCVRDFSDDKIYFIEPLIGLMNSPFLDEELVGPDTSRWPPPQGPPTASPQSLQEHTWPFGTLDLCFLPINAVQPLTQMSTGYFTCTLTAQYIVCSSDGTNYNSYYSQPQKPAPYHTHPD